MKKNLLPKGIIAVLLLISNYSAFAQTISFGASPNNGCAPLAVTFTNFTTDPNAYRYQWSFNDGSPTLVDTMPTTVVHTYTGSGNYNVNVQVFRSDGFYLGNYSVGTNINVNGASMQAPDSACVNDMASFCVNGSNLNSFSWNFGDPSSGGNNTSNQGCPQHSYASNGTYTVTVVVNSSSCGTQTLTHTVYISTNAYPHPYANVDFNSTCPSQPVTFNSNGGVTYSWNFGDPASGASNTSTLANPQHTYSGLGTFTATVTVTNGCGHTGTATNTVNVVTSPPFPTWWSYQLDVMGSPACPGTNLGFNATYGYNNYQWDFGDGSPVMTTTSNNTNHTYGATLGTFNASVTITTPCGHDTVLYHNVVISNTAAFPTMGFQMNTSSPSCPNSYVNFDAPGGYTNYVWNFGDGSPAVTSTDSHAEHHYGSAITSYTASVTITNGCGNDTVLTSVVQIMSNVGFPNQSWFSLSGGPSPGCHGDPIGVNAPGGYSNYAWDFGDGNTSSGSSEHVTHIYPTSGSYTVSVTITNACGNDTVLSAPLIVNSTGSFPSYLYVQASPSISCPNDLIELQVNQSGYASYAWNFGDGNTATSTGERIQHGYSAVGTYTVTCVITNGCGLTTTISGTVQVSASSPVNPNLSIQGIQNPSCPNDEVFFVIDQGQSTYNYVWNFGDGSPTVTTVGTGTSHVYAATGSYTVSATVTNGCGLSTVKTMTQVVSGSAVPVLAKPDGGRTWGFPGSDHSEGTVLTAGCMGDAIVFYFEGAAATNLYNFGDGSTGTAVDQLVVYGGDGAFPVTIIRHAFAANGNYLITLTLTNGCGNSVTDTMTIHIGGGLPVDGDMTTSPPPFSTCAPIGFLAFGGATYDWNFGDGATLSTPSSSVSHTFATAGVHVVTVLVTNGCGNTATFSRSLNVTGVGGPAITVTSTTPPTCVSGSNGSATISVSSGQAPYTYAWNDAAGQTSATATNLPAGLYYATVTDDIGCASTLAVNVSNPAPIVPNITTTTTACGAATGSATVNITSGGTAPYTYLWSTGITTATATGLATGPYTVMITDANSCTATGNASVSENGGATLSVNTITNAACNGSTTGAININVTGGAAPYTYLWSNAATVQDPSGLAAGNYSVTVTDNSGCHATLNATVSQPTPIVVTTAVSVSPTCGNFDGTATSSATGGVGPYTYHWDAGTGGTGQTTATATNLPAGTYTVTVTDATGCTMNGTIDLSNSNAPNITAVVSNVSCFGGNDGAIDITITGGTSPYLKTWSVAPPQTNHEDVNTLTPGNYFVYVSDAHNCLSFRTYTVTQPNLLTATVTNTGVTCGNIDGTATATPVGGNTSFSYAWTPGAQTTQTANGLNVGSYTVTVTDNKGCVATASTTLTATTLPQEICMVTVDTGSTHNIIFWEKPAVTNVDSFRVYREDVTNVYTFIGAVAYDSLSEYHDFGADPNTTTKRYKITAKDNCGGESAKSNYHNTIYIVDDGMGQFSWNPLYTIENGANPVDNYRLMRDDNNTGVWNQVAITSGTQFTLVDPSYASYPNGKWYVETVWGITCTPTRAAINTTRSNIRHAGLATGINTEMNNSVSVYPNPANSVVTIALAEGLKTAKVKIMNVMGQVVFEDQNGAAGTSRQIDISGFAKGIYTVTIENNGNRVIRKLIIN